MKPLTYEHVANLFMGIIATAGLVAIVSGIVKGIIDAKHLNKDKKKIRQENFNAIVSQLTSQNKSSQLSAAILIRRFFDTEYGLSLKNETLSIISSLSRVLPTGIFQKTLVDGLAYASDISFCDLQKTNLQDAYLGVKEGILKMEQTDFFLSDLSYALIQNVIAHKVIFYRTILLGAQIKDSDLTNGDFRGSDLTNVTFKNVILKDANFTDAYNIPLNIREN